MAGRVVTIDGPAGAGKSTIAKRLAGLLGFVHFDSGAVYRAFAAYCIRTNLATPEQWALRAPDAPVRVEGRNGGTSVYLNDECLDVVIRTPEVTKLVSPVSSVIPIRKAVNIRAADFAKRADIVADGRDIGSVVFPGAQLKIFLDASPLIRAQRRLAEELGRGRTATLEQILADQEARDANDRNKPWGALVVPTGAEIVDTSDMNPDQVLEHIFARAKDVFSV